MFKHTNNKFYFAIYRANGTVKLRSEGFVNATQRDEELSGVLKHQGNEKLYSREERGNFYIDILHDKTGREIGRSCLHKMTNKTNAKWGSTSTTTITTPKSKTKSKPKTSTSTSKKGVSEVYKDSVYGLKSDNLQVVEGIGPKINQLLNADGIVTWRQLSQTTAEHLKNVLTEAGPRFKMHNPRSWPNQARFAADGDWNGLIQLQKVLDGGKDGSNTVSDSKLEKMLIKKGKMKK